MSTSRAEPTLSVCTVSLNEERDLPRFLENFLPWVDQIVIVDDGSTDRTPAIATAAGPRVTFVTSPRGSDEGFAHQRNKSSDAAWGDWILHVDVDMRVTRELAEEILAAIRDPGKDLYSYYRLHHFLNRPLRHGGVQHWKEPWLFRAGVGRFEGLVHEKFRFDLPSERVGLLRNRMLHLGDDDFVERLTKNVAYSRLEAADADRGSRRVSLLGSVLTGAKDALNTYVRHGGFLDGRAGLFWALYKVAGTINRHLLIYDRQNRVARERLEEQVRRSMRGFAGVTQGEPDP